MISSPVYVTDQPCNEVPSRGDSVNPVFRPWRKRTLRCGRFSGALFRSAASSATKLLFCSNGTKMCASRPTPSHCASRSSGSTGQDMKHSTREFMDPPRQVERMCLNGLIQSDLDRWPEFEKLRFTGMNNFSFFLEEFSKQISGLNKQTNILFYVT